MKKIALALMGLTLWCDLNLILGVFFTGTYGKAKVSAQIAFGNCMVDSHTHDGAVFIMIIAIWTAALAICGLLALRTSPLQTTLANS
jgi:hypothetical protein